jgi:phosphate uptake regulator
MARRKIIKQANQAYTLTLPIDWVRVNNLDKKDSEVEVFSQDKSLTITNTGNVALKKVKLVIEDCSECPLWSRFNALYARGVDEIEVHASEDISSMILECISQDIGYALVSQNKGVYTVKDIGGGNYSDTDEIFKRVFQMVLMFYDSAIQDIFGEQKETLEKAEKRDEEINKFCLYLQRAINKMSYADPIRGRILFTYSFMLEKIGDEILRLWRTNINQDVKKSEKVKEIVHLSRQSLDLVFDFYYTFNTEIADEIYLLKRKARKTILSLSKQDASTISFVHYALQIIEDSADITHLNLMKGL